jgi:hydroxymethylpyrimidine/phosphomethylpyrimidine kinase
MISTSGACLLKASALELLKKHLLPLAWLVTPNLPEAEVLVDAKIESPEDMRQAAKRIHERFGCAVLVKGGHLRASREAVDIFYDGKCELLLTAPFVKAGKLHGTGCTYSAAITAYIARGKPMREALLLGKNYITQAIANSLFAANCSVLNAAGDV